MEIQNSTTAFEKGALDPITGLADALLLKEELARACARATRNHSGFTLLQIEIQIQPEANTATKNEVFKAIVARLLKLFRANDYLSRINENNFAIICENIITSEHVEKCAKKVIDVLTETFTINGKEFSALTKIGAVQFPQDTSNPQELFTYADQAKMKAKEQPGVVFCLFSSFREHK